VSDRDRLFEELFRDHYPAVVRYFVRRGFSPEESRDLAQETFVRVHRYLGTLRDCKAGKSWVFTVAINLYRNELRSRAAKKRASFERSLEELTPGEQGSIVGEAADPGRPGEALERLLTLEQLKLLREAIDELPPRMRQAVFLRVDQDLKNREIAVVMDVAVDTVKALLHQARKRLREILGDYFEGIDF
jgi:RNA polymerase sigma-70 factor (ECF subfamily)